jgi:hypothetical protein
MEGWKGGGLDIYQPSNLSGFQSLPHVIEMIPVPIKLTI